MVNKFLLNSFLSNNLYLGYSKNFRHASMLFDILSTAKNTIDVHNLNHTVSVVRKLVFQFQLIWFRYGNVWFVVSKLPTAIKYSQFFEKTFLANSHPLPILTLWYKNWVSGLLTNKGAFKVDGVFKYFPSAINYLNYTFNKSKFNEAGNLHILQTGIADTNSDYPVYQYGINANEKTTGSYLFLFKLFLASSYNHTKYAYKNFLINS